MKSNYPEWFCAREPNALVGNEIYLPRVVLYLSLSCSCFCLCSVNQKFSIVRICFRFGATPCSLCSVSLTLSVPACAPPCSTALPTFGVRNAHPGGQPPSCEGCCRDARSPGPRLAQGGVVRSPTDRRRRRCAPGENEVADIALCTRRWATWHSVVTSNCCVQLLVNKLGEKG